MKKLFIIILLTYASQLNALDLVSNNSSDTGSGNAGNYILNTSILSANGRFATFASESTDLVSGVTDNNASADVYLKNLVSGEKFLVSFNSNSKSTTANNLSYQPIISGDGRYVAYVSYASNIVSGFTLVNSQNIYLFDQQTQTNILVNRSAVHSNKSSDDVVYLVGISDSGDTVYFLSNAQDLINGFTDNNTNSLDLYAFNTKTLATKLISHAAGSTTSGANSDISIYSNFIDGKNKKLVFSSYATNLVSSINDTNMRQDVFIYDTQTSAISLVSHIPSSNLTAGSRGAEYPIISKDGSSVLFESDSDNYVTAESNPGFYKNIYKYNISTKAISLLSGAYGSTTTSANLNSTSAVCNYDCSVYAFLSAATDLIAGLTDTNSVKDAFVFHNGSLKIVSVTPSGTAANAATDAISLDPNGDLISFRSSATNLVSGITDSNSDTDIFLRNLKTSKTELLSKSTSGTQTGNSYSHNTSISWINVLFDSFAGNLIGSDNNANGSDGFITFRQLISVSSPTSEQFIEAETIPVTGKAESGALIRAYLDSDEDGEISETDTIILENQLSSNISTYSINVPLKASSNNKIILVAVDNFDNESLPVLLPNIFETPTFIAKRRKTRSGIYKLKITDDLGNVRFNRKPFRKYTGKFRIIRKDVNSDGYIDIIVKARINGKRRIRKFSGADLSRI